MEEAGCILAVDGGGTKTEAALLDAAGAVLARTRTGPCNLYQDAAAGLAAVEAAWQACAASAGLDPAKDRARVTLSAGLAGVTAADAPARFHARFAGFARRFLSSDGYLALLGAFDGAPGALLSIGTGVVGYRLQRDGRIRSASGWGFPVGDRGGGAWLGFALAADWLEALDGYGPIAAAHPLARELARRAGTERSAILAWLRAARPAEFAALARPIVDQAAAGDAYARALMDRAADHLARVARALEPMPSEPLVLAGGLAPAFAPLLAARLGGALLAAERMPSPLHGGFLVGIGRAAPEFPHHPEP
jgi:glucosamine kinase